MCQRLKTDFYQFYTFLLLLLSIPTIAQNSENMTLLSNWDEVPEYSDIWGYADEAGGEYAIIGSNQYTHFINITDPTQPVEVARIAGATNSDWRDFKTYQHYAYGVSEGGGSLQIFDLSSLPTTVLKVYDSTAFFTSCHNIFIDEANGRLYAVGSTTANVVVLDLSANPAAPTLLGNVNLTGGYVHDIYVRDHVAYCSHGNHGLEVIDFTDVDNIIPKGSLTSYQDQGYNHSSWLSADGQILAMADETKNLAVKLVSVADLTDIEVVSTFKSTLEEAVATNSIAHNPFIVGNDYVVVSYYHDGIQIYNIQDPANPVRAAYYDTDTTNTNYNGGRGSWGVYPYLPSGNIIAADIFNGLFVLHSDIDLTIDDSGQPQPPNLTETQAITYTEDLADFPNPERGFYRYSETSSNNYQLLESATLAAYRDLHTPPSADYSIYSTLVFRYFLLENFINAPISQAYLDNMQIDFNEARKAGVKLIPRFTYTTTANNSCGDTACAPFGDASKAQILAHIAQLKPLLQANKDVIAALQMGFIGIWGEQYYTDHFGYAGAGALSTANIEDRNEVLNALLDALPTDRMVQARIPQYKQKAIYGVSAATTAAPLTTSEAYNGSNKARIGHHNDCFLTSYTDYGTYIDLNNNSDTSNLKPYLATDSKYVVVGGETCGDINPRSNCAEDPDSGDADIELRRFHYSYLNSQYNNEVNNDWKDYCLEDIKRNLGYRFVLETGTYPMTAAIGNSMNISFQLKNVGYAAPFNPRKVELVLRNTANPNQFFTVALSEDPRLWLPNASVTINQQICIGYDVPAGTYDLSLHLPDPESSLYGRPEYSIRLANDGIWEANTGYNVLVSDLEIPDLTYNGICEARLVFGSKDCGTKLNIANIPTPSGSYVSADSIVSTSVLPSTETVTFTAPSITLKAGFHAKSGSQFLAKIGGCAFVNSSNTAINEDLLEQSILQDTELTSNPALEGEHTLHVFPNPLESITTIQFELAQAEEVSLRLFDINGRFVKEVMAPTIKEERTYQLKGDFSDLDKGIYFLILQTSTKVYKRKMVIL